MYADYYAALGNYQKAYEHNEEIVKQLYDKELSPQLNEHLERKAELLVALGRHKEAADTFAQALKATRDNHDANFTTQLNELRTLYDLHKVEQEALESRLQLGFARKIAIAVGVIAVLLIVLCITVFRNARRIRNKNRGLVRRIREQDELKVANAALREELSMLKKSQETTEPEERMDTLHIAFRKLMLEDQFYTRNKVTRPEVAQLLGVSEKMLSNYVRDQYQLSFPAYIAHQRLEHAKKAISDVNNRRSLESIGLDAGFGSRSSFHRQFKEVYGLSPEEFRRTMERGVANGELEKGLEDE